MAHEDEGSDSYNSECFVCGKDNPHGLRLVKLRTDRGYAFKFIVDRHFCSANGAINNGIAAAVLDEAMGDAANDGPMTALTIDMTVKYINTAHDGAELFCNGEVSSVDGRCVKTYGTIRETATGRLIAEAFAHYLRVSAEKLA